MLKLCLREQEDSAFFSFFYLHKLPRELHMLLAEEDFSNRLALAGKTDHLWAHNSKQGGRMIAAIVATVRKITAPLLWLQCSTAGLRIGSQDMASKRQGISLSRVRVQRRSCWRRTVKRWRTAAYVIIIGVLQIEPASAGSHAPGGKLGSQGCLNIVTPGPLVYIKDDISNMRFLCDTCASYSVFPLQSSSDPAGPELWGALAKHINCLGEREIHMKLHCGDFKWIFLQVDVQFLILVMDFLRHCGEPAISLHSHYVSLVQWTTRLLPVTRDLGSNPLGGTYVKPRFSY